MQYLAGHIYVRRIMEGTSLRPPPWDIEIPSEAPFTNNLRFISHVRYRFIEWQLACQGLSERGRVCRWNVLCDASVGSAETLRVQCAVLVDDTKLRILFCYSDIRLNVQPQLCALHWYQESSVTLCDLNQYLVYTKNKTDVYNVINVTLWIFLIILILVFFFTNVIL